MGLARLRDKLEAIHERLLEAYGRPRKRRRNPVDVLVGTILSQNTTDKNAHEAFRRLKGKFRTWERVATAPVGE
ncbi:MAG TPA: endonuclease III, partial [Armatimonadetes bacterium]|nr:endonuclease III [Armatimonadota bacterium]